MLIVNKLATFYIPAPAFVASVQIVVCCVVLVAMHVLPSVPVEIEPPTKDNLIPYAKYAALFALSIFTNIHALQHSNVETVIVFRSATPIAVRSCAPLTAVLVERHLVITSACTAGFTV
jgi:hypothetical protein